MWSLFCAHNEPTAHLQHPGPARPLPRPVHLLLRQAGREGRIEMTKGTQEKGKGREEKRRAERRREGKMAAQRGAVKARGQLHWISEHLRPYLLTANSRWNS